MKYLRHYYIKVPPPIVTVQVNELATYSSDFLPQVGDYCTVGKYRYKVVKVYEPYPAIFNTSSLYHVNIEVEKEN